MHIFTLEKAVCALRRHLLWPRGARRTQVFGVGMGKSGTHSLAAIFTAKVRAAHELEALPLLARICDWHDGRLDEAQLRQWLRARDRRLRLEVDSSALNAHVLELLLTEFPAARFVLTIRDCYTWLDSAINHALRFPRMHPLWFRNRRLAFGYEASQHAPEEQLLRARGLYPLDRYLAYWARHNQRVLDRVPEERLLVVRTDHIHQRALQIASFAGLSPDLVRPARAHRFKNPAKQPIVAQLDRAFLEDTVARHCRPLMGRFFPEIRSIEDAMPGASAR